MAMSLFVFIACKNKGGIYGEHNGYEYVDLGLSVKWATCNIGANNPEDFGDYFALGEVKPKLMYTWENYKHCIDNYNNLTKYCNDSSLGNEGLVDNKIILDIEDDAAYNNWGGKWRMPTREEQNELWNKCKWTWTTLNGVNGYLVTSKIKGYTDCSIFLPATGIIINDSLYSEGTDAAYWSNTFNTGVNSSCGFNLSFFSDGSDKPWDHGSRYGGMPIRPVCP